MPRKEPIYQFLQSVGQLTEQDQDMILRTLRLLQSAPCAAQEHARSMLRECVQAGAGSAPCVRDALKGILAYLSLHQSRNEFALQPAIGAGRDSLL